MRGIFMEPSLLLQFSVLAGMCYLQSVSMSSILSV